MVSALPALAADSTNTAPVSNDAFVAEFHSIIDRVNAKIESGEVSAEVLAPELNAIEALPARHPEQSVDDQAYVLTQEAVIYLQVLHDPIMVEKVLKRIVHDFPTSKFTPLEMENIQKLQPAIALAQIRASLTNGVVFPDFQERWYSSISGQLGARFACMNCRQWPPPTRNITARGLKSSASTRIIVWAR